MDQKTNNNAANGYWIHDAAGPKTYVPPNADADPAVIDEIEQSLAEVEWLDASRLQVSLQDGEVVLSGIVPSQNAQRQVVQCAHSAAGGLPIVNHIGVQSPRDEIVPDA